MPMVGSASNVPTTLSTTTMVAIECSRHEAAQREHADQGQRVGDEREPRLEAPRRT